MRIRIQMRILSQPYKTCKKLPYKVLKKTKQIAQKIKKWSCSMFTSFLKAKIQLILISLHFSNFFNPNLPSWIRIREVKWMWIHTEPDPEPWFFPFHLWFSSMYFFSTLWIQQNPSQLNTWTGANAVAGWRPTDSSPPPTPAAFLTFA